MQSSGTAPATGDQAGGVSSSTPAPLGDGGDEPPVDPKSFNPLRWVFDQTFARRDRAVFITAILGAIEFSIFSPIINWVTSHVVSTIDPTKIPEFTMPEIDSIARVGLVCWGIGCVLFGLSGFPKTFRRVLEPTIGRALSTVLHPSTVQDGFVFGKAPRIKDANPKVLFESPRAGEYSVADLKTWGYEIGINWAFYPSIALALDLPVQHLLPAAGLSIFATIGTARMSKIWGSDRRPFWWIVIGRTAIFSLMNAFAPLAACLSEAGILSAGAGYGVQAAFVTTLSAAAYFVVQPKTPEALPPPEDEDEDELPTGT